MSLVGRIMRAFLALAFAMATELRQLWQRSISTEIVS